MYDVNKQVLLNRNTLNSVRQYSYDFFLSLKPKDVIIKQETRKACVPVCCDLVSEKRLSGDMNGLKLLHLNQNRIINRRFFKRVNELEVIIKENFINRGFLFKNKRDEEDEPHFCEQFNFGNLKLWSVKQVITYDILLKVMTFGDSFRISFNKSDFYSSFVGPVTYPGFCIKALKDSTKREYIDNKEVLQYYHFTAKPPSSYCDVKISFFYCDLECSLDLKFKTSVTIVSERRNKDGPACLATYIFNIEDSEFKRRCVKSTGFYINKTSSIREVEPSMVYRDPTLCNLRMIGNSRHFLMEMLYLDDYHILAAKVVTLLPRNLAAAVNTLLVDDSVSCLMSEWYDNNSGHCNRTILIALRNLRNKELDVFLKMCSVLKRSLEMYPSTYKSGKLFRLYKRCSLLRNPNIHETLLFYVVPVVLSLKSVIADFVNGPDQRKLESLDDDISGEALKYTDDVYADRYDDDSDDDF